MNCHRNNITSRYYIIVVFIVYSVSENNIIQHQVVGGDYICRVEESYPRNSITCVYTCDGDITDFSWLITNPRYSKPFTPSSPLASVGLVVWKSPVNTFQVSTKCANLPATITGCSALASEA